jgi:hypothetical protein
MKTKQTKYYMSTIVIRNGEYETLTNYCFQASDREAAEKEVTEGFDIGGDDWEQQAELYSLVEVTKKEYDVLNKFI